MSQLCRNRNQIGHWERDGEGEHKGYGLWKTKREREKGVKEK